MKYQLIKTPDERYSAKEQVLINRGIEYENIEHYLNTTDDDINDFRLLGETKLIKAGELLLQAIENDYQVALVVDCDVDGYASSALLLNYLYKINAEFTTNNIKYFMHEGKQHGLQDCVNWVLENDFKLVICPDSASNDLIEHKKLDKADISIIILDHHDLSIEEQASPAIIINSQLRPYPNESLSGAGVVYQFCRYLDTLFNVSYADEGLDLVALALTGDVMSLRAIETKHLINKGLQSENIHNPFIYYMWQKNRFKLGDYITSWGAAFYIVPFVNAIVRSGTQEEKELIFDSMLTFRAFEDILSNKRGHKQGETEKRIEQAIRTCINVKRRQEKERDECLQKLEEMIIEQDLLVHKVLLFLVKPNEIEKNIAGLCASQLAAKYFRPCCILIKDKNKNIYSGSARGSDKTGVRDFKKICINTGLMIMCEGHPSAFGLSIAKKDTEEFLDKTDEALKDNNDEVIYYVDYIFKNKQINPRSILEIARMDNLWGKDVEESIIAIEGLKVDKSMITLMSADKNPTLKISLPNDISIIKFRSGKSEYESFTASESITMNIVGRCNRNEWMGSVTPQILVEDYEITDRSLYYF